MYILLVTFIAASLVLKSKGEKIIQSLDILFLL